MTRLIDADKLYLHLNDWALAESPTGFEVGEAKLEREVIYQTIMYCMKAVDDQPAAYDIEKVVEELDSAVYTECICDIDGWEICEDLLKADMVEDIIRRGGVE